jgi:hypothetical protein
MKQVSCCGCLPFKKKRQNRGVLMLVRPGGDGAPVDDAVPLSEASAGGVGRDDYRPPLSSVDEDTCAPGKMMVSTVSIGGAGEGGAASAWRGFRFPTTRSSSATYQATTTSPSLTAGPSWHSEISRTNDSVDEVALPPARVPSLAPPVASVPESSATDSSRFSDRVEFGRCVAACCCVSATVLPKNNCVFSVCAARAQGATMPALVRPHNAESIATRLVSLTVGCFQRSRTQAPPPGSAPFQSDSSHRSLGDSAASSLGDGCVLFFGCHFLGFRLRPVRVLRPRVSRTWAPPPFLNCGAFRASWRVFLARSQSGVPVRVVAVRRDPSVRVGSDSSHESAPVVACDSGRDSIRIIDA